MNYEPNLTRWNKGDVVIHDADAKRPHMLMHVIGYTRDGLVKTRYINKSVSRKLYTNEPIYLHDPKRFAIEVSP